MRPCWRSWPTICRPAPEPTEWVLGDITIIATANGFAHGAIRLFADGGRLLATASQSMILRYRDEAPLGAVAQDDA
jgi:acyl-CoA thioesterase